MIDLKQPFTAELKNMYININNNNNNNNNNNIKGILVQ